MKLIKNPHPHPYLLDAYPEKYGIEVKRVFPKPDPEGKTDWTKRE